MECLTDEQVQFYRDNGYLVVPGRVDAETLDEIRSEIARFIDEARKMSESNERIDLEDSHSPDVPRVRRIKRPDLHSDVMKTLMYSDAILAPVRDLIGPDLRLQTAKLNMKSAEFGAAVEWHQDFAFYPHTNDDVLAVGVLIDDVGHENGPLMVFPGSHKGPIHDHHADGAFIGAMDLGSCGYDMADAVELSGTAGSISIHHARIVHGSALNRSDRDRRLLFYEMMAADAWPVCGGMTEFGTLAEYDTKMLCGTSTITPRVEPVPIRIPRPQPDEYGSIYEIQKGLATRSFETLS